MNDPLVVVELSTPEAVGIGILKPEITSEVLIAPLLIPVAVPPVGPPRLVWFPEMGGTRLDPPPPVENAREVLPKLVAPLEPEMLGTVEGNRIPEPPVEYSMLEPPLTVFS
jgi:hypothetical protein